MRYIMMNYAVARRRHDGMPILVATTGDDIWYIGGQLRDKIRGEFLEQYDILKEYGEEVDNSGEMYDRFLQDYPPQPSVIRVEPGGQGVPQGWLSPDGKWFPCPNGDHVAIAYELAVGYHGETHVFDSSHFLQDRGWVRVGYGIVTFNYDMAQVTEAQIAALKTMQTIGVNEEHYAKGFDLFFELSGVEEPK